MTFSQPIDTILPLTPQTETLQWIVQKSSEKEYIQKNIISTFADFSEPFPDYLDFTIETTPITIDLNLWSINVNFALIPPLLTNTFSFLTLGDLNSNSIVDKNNLETDYVQFMTSTVMPLTTPITWPISKDNIFCDADDIYADFSTDRLFLSVAIGNYFHSLFH